MSVERKLFIAGWQIDADLHRIARDGVEVRLEPRSMELLLYLAQCPDRVVSREEIEQNVWQGRVVSYQVLSGAIVKLRKAFGDTSKQHQVIETVPKSGYRLIAPVVSSDLGLQPSTRSLAGASNALTGVMAAVAIFALIVAAPEFRPESTSIGNLEQKAGTLDFSAKPSIAVLPFSSVPEDPELKNIAFGLGEDLSTGLSRLPGMLVVARNSLLGYEHEAPSSRQIAADLGVRYVLVGSVRGNAGQLRVNALLIDAASGGNLWGQRYDGNQDQGFAFQDEVARKIVKALSVQLTPPEQIKSAQRNTSNPQAYKTFLQASRLRSFDSPHEFSQTVYFYHQAIKLDPAFGDAYAALARLYWRVVIDELENVVEIPRFNAINQMYNYARKSAEFPTASGYEARALIMARQNRWEEAIEVAKQALVLEPNFSNGMSTLSYLLMKAGKFTQAQAYLSESMRLDPEKKCYWLRASLLFHLEEYQVAASQLQAFAENAPENSDLQLLLAASHGHLGNYVEGQAAVRKYDELWAKKGLSRPFSVSELNHWSFGDSAQRRRIQVGLLKAGMPKD